MTIYLAIYLALVILAFGTSRRLEPVVLPAALFLLFIFVGFRDKVGCDWAAYLNRFENFKVQNLVRVISRPEPIYEALTLFVKGVGLNFIWLNALVSGLTFLAYWRFLRVHRLGLFILPLLYAILIIQLNMSGSRQSLAVAFLLLAACAFINARKGLTGAWLLAGSQAHLSLLAFLPMSLLAGSQVRIKTIAMASVVALPLAMYLIGDRVEVYQDRYIDEIYGEQSSFGAIFRYVFTFVPSILFLSVRKDNELVRLPEYGILRLFSVLGLAIGLSMFASTVALHRLNYYILPFAAVSATYLAFSAKGVTSKKILGAILYVSYGCYALVWQLTSNHFDACFANYQNWLLG